MDHIPFLSFPDGLEITVSEVKKKLSGSDYVTIYFEQPNEQQTDFCSAQYDYPGGNLENVKGYKKEDFVTLLDHIARIGEIALDFSRGRADA